MESGYRIFVRKRVVRGPDADDAALRGQLASVCSLRWHGMALHGMHSLLQFNLKRFVQRAPRSRSWQIVKQTTFNC